MKELLLDWWYKQETIWMSFWFMKINCINLSIRQQQWEDHSLNNFKSVLMGSLILSTG